MKLNHKVVHVYSYGDNANSHWEALLECLNQGYQIVSAVADERAIHYILLSPVEEKTQ